MNALCSAKWRVQALRKCTMPRKMNALSLDTLICARRMKRWALNLCILSCKMNPWSGWSDDFLKKMDSLSAKPFVLHSKVEKVGQKFGEFDQNDRNRGSVEFVVFCGGVDRLKVLTVDVGE